MIVYNGIIYCILLLFYAKLVICNESKKKPQKNSDDVKQTFGKLLKTIVRVNEERMDAVKKMIELQDYMLTKNKLKTDYDSYDSLEDEDSRILLAFADLPRLRRAEDEAITRAMCRNVNLSRRNNIWTRNFLKRTCHEHSIKLCADACMKSLDDICEKLPNCNVKTRRDSRSVCEDNCRNIFLNE